MGFGSIAGALTGAIGAIAGNYAGNQAASSARGAAGAANDRLIGAKGDALQELRPYSQYGQQALIPLSALLYGKNYDPATGQFTGDISQADRFNAFQQSPGYQYQLDEGLKAIQRQNAATGTLLGGNTLKELQAYGTNLANQDYNNYINTLINQAGIGQQAATNSANIISGIGGQMANYDYAGGMANAQKYSNLSNFLFGLSGMGFSNALGAGQQSSPTNSGGGGGVYNGSFFNSGSSGQMSPFQTLTMAGGA